MIFYLVRHGDPIYADDTITPLGKRQAEAVGKRLSFHGLDKIFSSPMKRAIETATPASELCKKEIEILDFCSENLAGDDFIIPYKDTKRWLFQHPNYKGLLASKEVFELGYKWHEHPRLKQFNADKKLERVSIGADELFKSLGYEHENNTYRYKCIAPNEMRVALFAHHIAGTLFLSSVLDIPLPMLMMRFEICHTGVTVLEFKDEDGYCTPRVLTYSNDSHIYKEGLPSKYNNSVYI